MENELFAECEADAGLSTFPLENWMKEALKNDASDCEALARIPSLTLRRECFNYVMDYRERDPSFLSEMAEVVKAASKHGKKRIGGCRIAGAVCLRPPCIHEVSNEAACFYVFVLSLTHPELAPYLESEGVAVAALRKAGWKP